MSDSIKVTILPKLPIPGDQCIHIQNHRLYYSNVLNEIRFFYLDDHKQGKFEEYILITLPSEIKSILYFSQKTKADELLVHMSGGMMAHVGLGGLQNKYFWNYSDVSLKKFLLLDGQQAIDITVKGEFRVWSGFRLRGSSRDMKLAYQSKCINAVYFDFFRYAVTSGTDSKIVAVDAMNGSPIFTSEKFQAGKVFLCTLGSNMLVTCSTEGVIKTWKVYSNSFVSMKETTETFITCDPTVAGLPDERHFVTLVHTDHTLKLWNASSLSVVKVVDLKPVFANFDILCINDWACGTKTPWIFLRCKFNGWAGIDFELPSFVVYQHIWSASENSRKMALVLHSDGTKNIIGDFNLEDQDVIKTTSQNLEQILMANEDYARISLAAKRNGLRLVKNRAKNMKQLLRMSACDEFQLCLRHQARAMKRAGPPKDILEIIFRYVR